MRGLGTQYKDAEASTGGDFVRLPAGGYVCRIIKVEDHGQELKPYIRVVYDINEGDYARFYADDWGKENEWSHDVRHYYTPASFGMFKGFLKAVDESNGTNFETAAEDGFDEHRLVGLLVGYLIGEEEYEANDGTVKTRLRVRGARPIDVIREGRFKHPELKKLDDSQEDAPNIPNAPDTANDLPF